MSQFPAVDVTLERLAPRRANSSIEKTTVASPRLGPFPRRCRRAPAPGSSSPRSRGHSPTPGPPALAALVVTAAVVAVAERRALRVRVEDPSPAGRPALGLGLVAVLAAAVLVVVLHNPAIPVAAVGVAVVGVRLAARAEQPRRVVNVLGVPVLVGLFGVAVALGTLGRVWSGPATLMSHLDPWGTAVVAAVSSVLLNNLPAASLFAARVPAHPFAMLVGLNLGPNLFVTGSLAWFLWLRAARTAGARPSIAKASRLGAVAVPLSMAAALGALVLTGTR